jgi:creatinine amidohydrolase
MKHDASEHDVAGLTWDRIGQQLRNGAAAILPIGAGAKEHGFHMPMATDQVFADYFARALAKKIDALIWPTLTYGAYPAFVSYAGSVSLSNEAFQAVVTEIADALVDFGARRVLILNTGLSTIAPVGSHADEIETSLMMVVAPELVDMAQATPSPFSAKAPAPGALSPDDPTSPNYSPSGSFGDPTLASVDKGSRLLAAILEDMMEAAG